MQILNAVYSEMDLPESISVGLIDYAYGLLGSLHRLVEYLFPHILKLAFIFFKDDEEVLRVKLMLHLQTVMLFVIPFSQLIF